MNWINEELVTKDTKAFVYEITLFKENNEYKYIGYTGTNKNWKEYN